MDKFKPEIPIAAQQIEHGAVDYTVGRTKDATIIKFNVPVKWLALTAQGARNLAADLRKMAAQLDKEIGVKSWQRPPSRKPPAQPTDSTSKRRRDRPRKRSRG